MKWAFRIIGSLVLLAVILTLARPSSTLKRENSKKETENPAEFDRRETLNRNASNLIYSKHARCRMGCRHISEAEVIDILRNGDINYQKSDMRGSPDPKYAVEGKTEDGQEVRIIYAQSPRGVVVVTVIDLDHEWSCDCK